MFRIKSKLIIGLTIMALLVSLLGAAPVWASSQWLLTGEESSSPERLAGADRYDTAAKIAQAGWPGTSDYAVLAAGMNANLVDALTAAPLAKLKNAPILLTSGDYLSPEAEKELQRLQVKTVYLTSGSQVLKPAVTAKLKTMGLDIKVLGGKDRFETALNIAREIEANRPFREVLIATAWSNADALSAASLAAAKGIPILLTNPDKIPNEVGVYLQGLQGKLKRTLVIGGSGVVGDSVFRALPSAQRAGGTDRYQTNLEILKLFANDIEPGIIYLANGENSHLVDSLAGAPLAALTGSPIVLTNGKLSAEVVNYVKKNLLPKEVIALGGEKLVPDSLRKELSAWTVYAEANWVKGPGIGGQQEIIGQNLRITGNNFTLQNSQALYSIYVQGNNCTLNNVTVDGTVFVDPGESGEATLKNVKAGRIVVMSGGSNSIRLENTTADTLVVTGDQGTRVVAQGQTRINDTVVTSYAILDAQGAQLGTVLITGKPGKAPLVELRGNFLDLVIVDTEGEVRLGDNTKVSNMEINTGANIVVPAGASIAKATWNQSVTPKFSGEGTVNDAKISDLPALPGGGGGGGGGLPTDPNSPKITRLRLCNLSGGELYDSQDVGGFAKSIDLTSRNPTEKIKYIYVSVSTDCTIKLTVEALGEKKEEEKPISTGAETVFDIDVILGDLQEGNDGVSLQKLKQVFGPNIKVHAEISQNGEIKDEYDITIRLPK
ncbi:MAG TPA: cell wall-binding repeat-containing protein [Peptococcaceae bacterium]|nr:cell wall-binding repeat-containing protein [Peptococcaceae bacterium]